MTTKKAIWLVIIAEVVIYLFLFAVLVGIPLFLEWAFADAVCTDVRDLGTPWPIYFIPAIFGIYFISIILKSKKEAQK